MAMTGLKTIECKNCGKSFSTQYNHQIFCSKICSANFHKKPSKEVTQEKECEWCKNKFIWSSFRPQQKFCSEKCHSEGRKYKPTNVQWTETRACKECKKDFTWSSALPFKEYCSGECRYEANLKRMRKRKNKKSDLNTQLIEEKVKILVKKVKSFDVNETGMLIDYYHINGFSEELKESVKSRDKYMCQICEKKTGLEVHHIIPRKHGGKHALDNLITLCYRCHRHIETGNEEHAVKKCVANYLKNLNMKSNNNEKVDSLTRKLTLTSNLELIFKAIKEVNNSDLEEALTLLDESMDLIN